MVATALMIFLRINCPNFIPFPADYVIFKDTHLTFKDAQINFNDIQFV